MAVARALLMLPALFCSVLLVPTSAAILITDLKTEYLHNPLGLDRPQPRFQWRITQAEDDQARSVTQTSYRIHVRRFGSASWDVWDSQEVASTQNYQIKYGGAALKSGTAYEWMVSVNTNSSAGGTTTSSSGVASFSMAMLKTSDWGGSFIGMSESNRHVCPWFRKAFTVPSTATLGDGALLYLASVGYQELYVNGQQVAPDDVLLPSISYLPKRVLYRTYNVSAFLKAGEKNAIGVWASAGWSTYGDLDHGIATNGPLILLKLQIGTSFSLVSDGSWKAHPSTIISTGGGPGGGDSLDDSKDMPDWSAAQLDDAGWQAAVAHPLSKFPALQISADAVEPTRRHSMIRASAVTASSITQPLALKVDPSQFWGVSSLRDKPVAAPPEPFCGEAGLIGSSTTNYAQLHLSCTSAGDSIDSINFAVWGVPSGGTAGCASWRAGDPCGNVQQTESWVRLQCVGKSNCTLDAIDAKPPHVELQSRKISAGKWDPCPGKKKTLVVSATCKLGKGTAISGHLPPPPPPPPPPGVWLVTMDELYTGWFEVRNMKGNPNTTVHFQVSTTAGRPVEFGMTDSYTFGSSGAGTFRMRFAYHEIRYITITGLKTQPAPSDVVGFRLTSLGKRTGDFSCSSDLISAMYNGTVNNYRGLTTGGMTVDCPHRERRGYGGDGHTSYQFALANYPVGAYFNKWTRDFADVQVKADATDAAIY